MVEYIINTVASWCFNQIMRTWHRSNSIQRQVSPWGTFACFYRCNTNLSPTPAIFILRLYGFNRTEPATWFECSIRYFVSETCSHDLEFTLCLIISESCTLGISHTFCCHYFQTFCSFKGFCGIHACSSTSQIATAFAVFASSPLNKFHTSRS